MALVVNFRGGEVEVPLDGASEELLTVGESALRTSRSGWPRTARWRSSALDHTLGPGGRTGGRSGDQRLTARRWGG